MTLDRDFYTNNEQRPAEQLGTPTNSIEKRWYNGSQDQHILLGFAFDLKSADRHRHWTSLELPNQMYKMR